MKEKKRKRKIKVKVKKNKKVKQRTRYYLTNAWVLCCDNFIIKPTT